MSLSSKQSQFVPTPLDAIPTIVDEARAVFHASQPANVSRDAAWQARVDRLRDLYYALEDHREQIVEAIQEDFHRSPAETITLEHAPLLAEIQDTINELRGWMKPVPAKSPLSMKLAKLEVVRWPLGVVLVIAPFNFPYFLSVGPMVGALAAGNLVVVKALELTPRFSMVLKLVVEQAFGTGPGAWVRVVNGSIPETTAVLEQKFDKILYTGNMAVAKIIAKKAAETLTPVVLELGGKLPVFVFPGLSASELRTVARRILWLKVTNAGQICVAADYVMVHALVHADLVAAMVDVLETEFVKDADASTNTYTHMIHGRAFERVTRMISASKGTVVYGGKSDQASLYVQPTIIDNVQFDDATMADEIFGPVLPVLEFSDINDALTLATTHHDTPLVAYVFSGNVRDGDLVQARLRSGGLVVNDTVLHVGVSAVPFGGVGTSGTGAYHGHALFETFLHARTTMVNPLWTDAMMNVRYPNKVLNKWNTLTMFELAVWRPWFKRTGHVRELSWWRYLFSGLALLLRIVRYSLKGKKA